MILVRPPLPPGSVDTHAHAFVHGLPLAAGRRYVPSYEAPLDRYVEILDAQGIAYGVLVQPSFLGTDNRHLLDSLRLAPARLRGVAVVDPTIEEAALAELVVGGVVGVRLNLIGTEEPDLAWQPWAAFLARLARFGLHLEIQAEGDAWTRLLPPVLASGVTVVVDHFGRPQGGRACPGFQAICRLGRRARLFVKLSAPYRFDGATADLAAGLLGELGPERLVWGSDWPWTQHEPGQSYPQCLEWLETWIPLPRARAAVLIDTPARLFGFPA